MVNFRQFFTFILPYMFPLPIPVTARSKAWVCGRSLPGLTGSNPAGTWMFVSCECRVLSGTGLCVMLISLPGESYRMCACLCMIYKPQEWEAPDSPGQSSHVRMLIFKWLWLVFIRHCLSLYTFPILKASFVSFLLCTLYPYFIYMSRCFL